MTVVAIYLNNGGSGFGSPPKSRYLLVNVTQVKFCKISKNGNGNENRPIGYNNCLHNYHYSIFQKFKKTKNTF